MKGLELSRLYYEKYGRQMISDKFKEYENEIAIGLVGDGSECLGYDDILSQDHDFEQGFCLFVTKSGYENYGFALERAYEKLPREFMGYERQKLSPVGGARRGVIVIDEFYEKHIGFKSAPKSLEQWLYIPSYALLSATNGEVFKDELGEFSKIRNELKKGYPEDIRKLKLAGHCLLMVQSGLYNYERCVKRREYGSAQIAIMNFVKSAISAIYLINNRYEPFYKWVYRGIRELPKLSNLESSLVALSQLGDSEEETRAKSEAMEEIAKVFVNELCVLGYCKEKNADLEFCAYEIQRDIKDAQIRNIHILAGV